jgi:hypothetical protein
MIFCGQPPAKNIQGRKGGENEKKKPKPDVVPIHHNVQSINNKLLELDHDQSNKKLISNKQTKNTFTVFHQNICGLIKKKRTNEFFNKKLPAHYLYNRTSLN